MVWRENSINKYTEIQRCHERETAQKKRLKITEGRENVWDQGDKKERKTQRRISQDKVKRGRNSE